MADFSEITPIRIFSAAYGTSPPTSDKRHLWHSWSSWVGKSITVQQLCNWWPINQKHKASAPFIKHIHLLADLQMHSAAPAPPALEKWQPPVSYFCLLRITRPGTPMWNASTSRVCLASLLGRFPASPPISGIPLGLLIHSGLALRILQTLETAPLSLCEEPSMHTECKAL